MERFLERILSSMSRSLVRYALLLSGVVADDMEGTEALKDSNAETRHHLLVDRLHREVYSQDFDLTTLLDRMRREEREEERDWKGSQVTASVAGSPTKVRFAPLSLCELF